MGILTNGTEVRAAMSDGDCKALDGIRRLMQSPQQSRWLLQFLEDIGRVFGEHPERPVGLNNFLTRLVEAQSATEPIAIREKEAEKLRHYLAVIKSGCWLEDFIAIECKLFEQGERRTPTQVIDTLAGTELVAFEESVSTTKHMLRVHADLFTKEIADLKQDE